jgi:hypothetical protein
MSAQPIINQSFAIDARQAIGHFTAHRKAHIMTDFITLPHHSDGIRTVLWSYFADAISSAQIPKQRAALIARRAEAFAHAGKLAGPALEALRRIEDMGVYPPTCWVLTPQETTDHPGYARWVPEAWARLASDHPELHSILIEAQTAQSQRAARLAAIEAQTQAARDAKAPAELLIRLRAAGIELDLDRAGHITAPAGAVLTAEDRAQIARHKPGVMALLKAETAAAAEAARPLVIA